MSNKQTEHYNETLKEAEEERMANIVKTNKAVIDAINMGFGLPTTDELFDEFLTK